MFHVYCEATGAETVTPDPTDAGRVFRKLIRDNPGETVTCDKIEGLGATDTAADIMLGDFTGRRVRFMHCEAQA